MKLQTIVPIEKANNPIDYQSKVLLLGSCFVENIGGKLNFFKFQTTQNPFGILFHPLAIENLIERALTNQPYQKAEVFEHDGIWHCFDAHSDISALSEQELLDNLNNGLEETAKTLKEATDVVLTLGTSWTYKHNSTQKTVANCHKVPQKEFSKELLSVERIQSSIKKMAELIQSVNEKAQIIFTISPVRHLKDGFVENQRSKAHLISAVHTILSLRAVTLSSPALSKAEVSKGQSRSLSYFPSYEIVMDELRDYRFYGKDMVHPNELSVDYIWEKFKLAWISPEIYPVMDEVEAVQKGLQHKSFNPDSETHQKFKKSLGEKITYLQERYPFMKF
ncbi:GSCFA domain-containing protein [Flagellimonas pacifica]|uniref:GSCFA family protein n=1 Tax=Flagellimonas pacifica TaxID=1247520 RepID=A0A285MA11_9FLAO|nr:GSCFA domain-containing protein [Allomuricauda parva]SNY92816.1 GSCFA family protein [Allomuricauda parva]